MDAFTVIKQSMSPNVRSSSVLKLGGAEEGVYRCDIRSRSGTARHFVVNEELARVSVVQQERPVGILSSVYFCEIGRTFQLADWREGL
ncbi:hypothetical protein MPLA_680014 [Mesorhizobium sp. ORS 3359]|uniref:hypothetical protein n=1 Tax=Mesorhizobium sp. LCM 4577 TaxID=1848288 RepID=UPI000507B444|nr:hypothetical protein [Mesorhizobium sp. LCM 4577]CDX43760.1 hypothetical protein MPLA_680014 [Mesorhizobium sp. ORS 3359]